jgi:uncharacterized protein (TIRG00374 family)
LANEEEGVTTAERPTAYIPLPQGVGRRSGWVRMAIAIGALAFIALFAFADLRELWRTLTAANPWLLPLPVACVILSYLTMARSYQGISLAAGYPVPFWEMLKITVVANAVNYLLATGGLSGFAVRMYFFTRLSVPSNSAVLISLAQTFLTNATLLFFIGLGFVYLITAGNLNGFAFAVTAVLMLFFVAAAIVALLLLFHSRWRRRTLFWLAQIAHRLLRRFSPHRAPARTHIWRYQFNLNRGIEFLLERKRQMLAPLLYIIADWIFTILILQTAFLTLRHPVHLGYVVVGFAVGIVLTFVTVIPGGLGVMEGSTAAMFASFGVPFETSVLAVLLFRLTYSLMPLLVSLFFLHGMLLAGTSIGREAPS